MSVKKSAVNNYPGTTGVDWDCPGEAGHMATLSPSLCTDAECGVALSVALDIRLSSSDWAAPTILSLIGGLFLPVSALPLPIKVYFIVGSSERSKLRDDARWLHKAEISGGRRESQVFWS